MQLTRLANLPDVYRLDGETAAYIPSVVGPLLNGRP